QLVEPQKPIAPIQQKAVIEQETKPGLRVKTREWGPKFEAVKQVFAQVSNDRQELAQIRDKYIEQYRKMATDPKAEFSQITQNISNDIVEYIRKRADETIKKLGPPPTKFCLFSMGSLPRGESGFFTD